MNVVIYCRVSSKEQVDGTSLESQETACRDFAARKGWTVLHAFIEQGESAKFADRSKLLELMNFCKGAKRGVQALLVWKLDRFARNIEDHYMIKASLRRLGVKVVSVTEPVDADPNGKLMEAILAGFAQFDNDLRAMRTVEGLQQRLREGIYPWNPPLGYLPPKMGKKREPDRPDAQRFTLLQRGWRLFLTGGYTRAEILRLLRTWGVTGQHGNPLSIETLEHILGNRFYAGILRNPWTGEEIAGRHVPMVTLEEFAQTQQLLGKKAPRRPYLTNHDDFPLRGMVRCASCHWPMTAGWSAGSARRYAYYSCAQRGCERYRKSASAASVHAEYETFLETVTVAPPVVTVILGRLAAAGADQQRLAQEAMTSRRMRIAEFEAQLRNLVILRADSLVSDAEFLSVRDNVRHRIAALQANGITKDRPLTQVEASGLVQALGDVPKLWQSLETVHRRVFGRFVMPAGYAYGAIRTADTAPLFRVFSPFHSDDSLVVSSGGKSSNSIIADIRAFLKILAGKGDPKKQAA